LKAAFSSKEFLMADKEQDKASSYGKIIAKAWRDPSFKAKLMADPHGTLKQAGVAVPAGVTVKVVEDTDKHLHVVLPPKPTGALSDEELDQAAGASGCGSATYSADQRHHD
jgi:hypothetical protein